MTATDLRLRITSEQIDALAGEWDDNGLWDDILWLSQELWEATEPRTRTVRWHHLCLAVGNFKRQAGRRLYPATLSHGSLQHTPGERLEVDVEVDESSPLVLTISGVDSWLALQERHGFGFATTTTTLAALWPTYHLIADWRVVSAVGALLIAQGKPAPFGIDASAYTPVLTDLELVYPTVRQICADTAEATARPIVEVERALYCLSQQVPSVAERTWIDYSRVVSAALDNVAVG